MTSQPLQAVGEVPELSSLHIEIRKKLWTNALSVFRWVSSAMYSNSDTQNKARRNATNGSWLGKADERAGGRADG